MRYSGLSRAPLKRAAASCVLSTADRASLGGLLHEANLWRHLSALRR